MTKTTLTIAGRIARAQPGLSRTQHKMAEYVLAHRFRVATMTIDEFAAAVSVSVATANQFARALDLPGYPQFRAELARGFEAALEPVETLRTELTHAASAAQIFAATLQEDIRNAQRTLRDLDAAACERAVDAILAAERVFIIGFGASGFLAGMLQRGLCMHPRSVASLADKPTAPLAPTASEARYAVSARQLMPNSETAALGLIEALSTAVACRAGNAAEAADMP
ncbi:MurR/RpiR family transcriptional regulator [Achromobacter insuavis]|uniref:Helix-turn-helix domain, RpiR family protein 3 n=1 Tax=Achromobacter insuavis AXX-A TaxID=1003200 RepID=F7T7X9_9BURK|nr:MurR/RpiR family transcriptional regulator [Achromobacter insuavis]EGP43629.1 helix-turn-helix domain, RpiR family protein 3 [Achromobacter insuavis AXX-A]